MVYYSMTSASPDENFGYLNGSSIPRTLIDGCRRSEFQHIPPGKITIPGIPGNKGYLDFYIAEGSVPLISEKMRQVFDDAGITPGEVLYRPAYITDPYGSMEPFYLMLPQRIKCLDAERSSINPIGGADPLYISSKEVGFFHIFKIAEITDKTIFVTQALRDCITSAGLNGPFFPDKIND